MSSRRPLRFVAATAMLFAIIEGPGCALLADIDAPATTTCTNGKADPDKGELGVDCGGVCRGSCPGGSCTSDDQCASFHCDKATKRCSLPTCDDKVWNATETDTDCGGSNPSCPRCESGQHCLTGQDCAFERCSGGACASCMLCGTYLTKQPLPDRSVLCNAKLFDDLVKCVCGSGPCSKLCGITCSGLIKPECQSCIMNAAGCGTPYEACTSER